MPSLPELEVYKHKLSGQILDNPITKLEPLDFRVVRATAAELQDHLVGHAITGIARYGKWLILSTVEPSLVSNAEATIINDPAAKQLILHLGLKGELHVLAPTDDLPAHAAMVIHFQDGRRLVLSDQRHFGKVYLRNFASLKAEKALGPDQLALTEAHFLSLGAKNRGVRDTLMDQKLIAGIGGKFADEMLWQAKLHPSTKISSLTSAELKHLFRLVQSITETAISLDADVGRLSDDWLIPHRHTDQVCPRCHTALSEHVSGGSSSYFCPKCQPAP